MWWFANEQPDLANNPVLKWLRGHPKTTDKLHDERFFVHQDGIRNATLLFLGPVLVFIGVKMLRIDDKIPVGFSLAVVATFIGISIVLSLCKERLLASRGVGD
ncbi:MAG: hypothetical protein IPP18_07035 [Rhodocyclaceae bacterium]|jgi:tellurite resistance protein TerC|nr:hypothetical protein [Rhodocyclaceae bacterium]MBK6554687.1 hypothetical protein [Rhodocyclaceae bacterium]MBK9310034.1 hypothetical protein [Rhodocyclaceae bacterium]MBK9954890.1 hypothetical protein [Rhodocyclaceae bacterium]